jgi:hypothetical protein
MKTKRSLIVISLLLSAFISAALIVSPAIAAQTGRRGAGLATLTEAETTDLLFMREEEKLARDVYIVLYEKWESVVFKNISASEQRHMDALKKLIVKYGLQDSASPEPGVFNDQELQALYNALVSRGEQSLPDAFEVGKLIEETDIEDLQNALAGTVKIDLQMVYGNLLRGSENHLRAFTLQIESLP